MILRQVSDCCYIRVTREHHRLNHRLLRECGHRLVLTGTRLVGASGKRRHVTHLRGLLKSRNRSELDRFPAGPPGQFDEGFAISLRPRNDSLNLSGHCNAHPPRRLRAASASLLLIPCQVPSRTVKVDDVGKIFPNMTAWDGATDRMRLEASLESRKRRRGIGKGYRLEERGERGGGRIGKGYRLEERGGGRIGEGERLGKEEKEEEGVE
eukprot:g3410.t1